MLRVSTGERTSLPRLREVGGGGWRKWGGRGGGAVPQYQAGGRAGGKKKKKKSIYKSVKENICTLLEIEQSKWTGNTWRIFTAN